MTRPASTIKLMLFDPTWGLPSSSPFCIKLHAWLTMAGLDFESVSVPGAGKGPKKKAPWIDDGEVVMGDSSLIIDYLSQKHGVDLDAALDDEQKAYAHLLQAMLEEHFYQVQLYTHFVDNDGWARMRECLWAAPGFLQPIIGTVLRRDVRASLWSRGMGRHAPQEIWEFGRRDMQVLSGALGDREYFFGRPSSFDACAFGFLSMMLLTPVPSPVRDHVEAELPNLVEFAHRFHGRFYAEQPALLSAA